MLTDKPLDIDGHHLTIKDVVCVARHFVPTRLDTDARRTMERSREWVRRIVAAKKPVYGINTGFGVFADQTILPEATARLNRNLMLSHSVATGPELPKEVVRAGMLIRANTLAIGNSGVRPLIVETLLEMLNRQVTPVIPSQGSLGSSGDLAPLSHLALVFTRDAGEVDREDESGWAYCEDGQSRSVSGIEAMRSANLPRLVLEAKEGLALNNGATFSTALAALAIFDAERLLDIAEVALAMSLEAVMGASAAFDPRIHTARNHPGQIQVAEHIRQLIQGSTLVDAAGRVQDAYSLRCAPQIQGAARDTLAYARQVIERELNAATDNPLLFDPGEALSGGNFHGEPVGMVMDFTSIAMAEVGAISERRIFRLTDSKLNAGLPTMLVDAPQESGLHSGMMMLQYTAASLVLENQTLAGPDSVHSLPTAAEQEDHNANAMTAARHARQIIQNTAHILAIELYCAARALDLRLKQRPQAQPGRGVAAAHQVIRQRVPYQAGDALWGPEVEALRELILGDEFLKDLYATNGQFTELVMNPNK